MTYYTRNQFVSQAAGLKVTMTVVVRDNEMPGADFPYYEGVSAALDGQRQRGLRDGGHGEGHAVDLVTGADV